MSGNEQVRREIEAFLEAIESYPARFAANPELTFEEHCTIVMLASRAGLNTEPETAVKGFAAHA